MYMFWAILDRRTATRTAHVDTFRAEVPGERRYENGTALELKQQHTCIYIVTVQGWSDGAMVLGKLPVPGVLQFG